MTDRDALIAAIAADPGDDLPRLVFADWVEENGDPAQAAFIRGHVELVRMKPGDPRRPRLADELRMAVVRHARDWVTPLCAAFGQPAPELPPEPTGGWFTRLTRRRAGPDTSLIRPHWANGKLMVPCTARIGQQWGMVAPLSAVHFGRGLPDGLRVHGHQVRDVVAYPAVLRAAPVTQLDLILSDVPDSWDRGDGPWFTKLRSLTLGFETYMTTFGTAGPAFEPAFRSSHLTGLRALTLSPGLSEEPPFENRVQGDAVAALAGSPLAGRLRILRVPLIPSVLSGFEGYPARGPLEELGPSTRSQVDMTPADWRRLADVPFRPNLRRLSLAANAHTEDALADLLRGPRWDELRALRVDENLLTDAAGVSLARLAPFPKLQALRLDRNRLGDDTARALARSPLVRTLRFLDLSLNRITADGALPLVVALAEGPLVRLRLGGNAITRRRRHRIRDILRGRVVLDP